MGRLNQQSRNLTAGLVVWSGMVAFSLVTRVFSFYTLPHLIKVFVFGHLVLTVALVSLRYIKPVIRSRSASRSLWVGVILLALILPGIFLASSGYHVAPIRTTHALQVENLSTDAQLRLSKFRIPGDVFLDLGALYPDLTIDGDAVILMPGETLNYQREMVGGVQFNLRALDSPALAAITWDGEVEHLPFAEAGKKQVISLSGASWGKPSLPYRLLGLISMVTDFVSMAGLLVVLMIIVSFKQRALIDEVEMPLMLQKLERSIIINTALVLLVGMYVLLFSERLWLLVLIFSVGILFYARDILTWQEKWSLAIPSSIFILGSLLNIYFYFNPYNIDHQVIQSRPENTFLYLADRIGASNATYLSVGYYRYFREAELVITPALYEELQLNDGRLILLNRLKRFTIEQYNDHIDQDQLDSLLAEGDWEIWPNRTGGEYYLRADLSQPGDTYYFFESDLRYFLIPLSTLQSTGVIDVSVSD